jgi:anti-sigma B factor antagonist
MELRMTDLGSARKIALQGRLDTSGVSEIETRFIASIVPVGKHALVDLSAVDFLASMGIRMLVMTARSMKQKKAQMIVFGAQPLVQESLDNVSLNSIVPVVASESEAMGLLNL